MRLRTLVSTRTGGVSRPPYDQANLSTAVGDDPAAVAENRHRLLGRLGLPRAAYMEQVHGAAVAVLAEPPAGPVPGVDGLVTAVPGLALVVLVADCVPVLLTDPVAGLVAVAHAGRRGVALGVVPATLAAMVTAGARPADIEAILGPAICGACYEVPAATQEEVAAAVPATRCTTRWGTPGLDLRAGLAAVLAGAGVMKVRRTAACTLESPAEYFSHRRGSPTGRFAGVAAVTG